MSRNASAPKGIVKATVSPVVAELLKVNRLLAHAGLALNKNRRRRIGPTQGRILAFLLSRSSHPVTLSNLAAGISLSPAAASEMVKALEGQRLVRKVRFRDDARVVHLSLTVAGRRMAGQAMAGMSRLGAAITQLPPEDMRRVMGALAGISESMSGRRNAKESSDRA